MNIGIIFAGGVGSRMNYKNVEEVDLPKQFIEVDGKPIIVWTLEYFEQSEIIDSIIVVMNENWIEYFNNILKQFSFSKIVKIVKGGSSSQESIYNGLIATRDFVFENKVISDCGNVFKDAVAVGTPADNSSDNDINEAEKVDLINIGKDDVDDPIVLLHDGVRPLITEQLLKDIVSSVKCHGTGISSLPATETIVFSSNGKDVTGVSNRDDTFVAGAPQGFKLFEIIDAHETVRKTNPLYTNIVDSCSLYHSIGKSCHLVKGPIGNIKLTRPEDIGTFKAIKAYRQTQ